MNKRGVELSMNLIIIAAIALIVLVVLVLLVTGSVGDLRSGTGCQNLDNGQCTSVGTGQTCASVLSNNKMVSGGQKNCDNGQVCCYQPFQ